MRVRHFRRLIGRVILYYLAVAISWILLSDALTQRLFTGSAMLPAAEAAKGLLFVGATAFLLLLLLRHALGEISRAHEDLLASESRLRIALEATGGGLWEFRYDEGMQYFSDGIFTMLGYEPGQREASGSSLVTLVHPDDRKTLEERFEAFRKGGDNPFEAEFRLRACDGTWRHILSQGYCVERQPDGTAVRAAGFHSDITARKLTELELRRSEETFRTYFDLGALGMAITSPEKRWIRVNRRLCEMLGYSREELDTLSWADLTHPEDLRLEMTEFERLVSGEISEYAMDKRFRRKDGSTMHGRVSVAAVRAGDGTIEYLAGTLEDVTWRAEAEKRILESEAHLRSIMETPRDFALFRLRRDPKEPFKLVPIITSPSLAELWAPARLDDFGVWLRQIHPEDRETFMLSLRSGIERPRGLDMVVRVSRRDSDDWRWLRCIVSPVTGLSGEVEYLNGIVTDETKRIQAERRLLRYQEQLRSLVSQLAQTEQLERQNIADYLHDEVVQTLALASMMLGDLRPGSSAEEIQLKRQQALDYLKRAIEDCRSLTIQLNPPVLERLGLMPAIESLAEEFGESHGITCTCRWEGPERRFDRSREGMVYRAVQELLTNVVRHANARRARIHVVMGSGEMRVTVDDDGQGFDAACLREAPSPTGGYGLLSIRERAAFLGGQCAISSSPGRGTSIELRIPIPEDN